MSSNNATKANNYRKPPREYQFKKGQSGNPNGRPKKTKMAIGASAGNGGLFDRLDQIALEEAMRPISVMEGDNVSVVPAIQALLRSMFRSSPKEPRIQRLLLEMVSRAENKRTLQQQEFFEAAARYKSDAEAVIPEHRKAGLPPPRFHPDPDDIILDPATGTATIDGPDRPPLSGPVSMLVH